MNKKTIFLLQDNYEIINELSKDFESDNNFEIVGKTCDGINAISFIADKRPDILIVDIILAGYDGLRVIEKIREQKFNIKIVVLSALCREEIVSKAISAGADYFMAKPYSFEILRDRINELYQEKYEGKLQRDISMFKTPSLEEKISKIFINVGIPPHIKGYNFLREGVKMAVENPDIINNITKKLYPMIGEKYKTSASKVERAIRHAIEVAWNRGRIEAINTILGVRAYVGADKPTNGEFIALVADKMLLEKA